MELFKVIFYEPILNLLVVIYNLVPGNDLGIAIILLTILIKLALLPLSKKSIKSQKALQELQPKVDEIKKKYSNNKEEMGKAMMALYATNKVNPFSSCLPLLIQLPFLIAVFHVFRDGFSNGALESVYSFINNPGFLKSESFFGYLDLAKPSYILAGLAGLAQFWQAKMMLSKRPASKSEGAKDENMMAAMNSTMTYVMPFITVVIAISFPGGLALYWLTTTLLTALQQLYILKSDKKIKDNEVLGIDKNKIVEGEIVSEGSKK